MWKNPLFWISIDENFLNQSKFAGDYNIAYILKIAQQIPLREVPSKETASLSKDNHLAIGVDGCKGGVECRNYRQRGTAS